ncbi:MAG: hypothetical protein K0S53_1366 [Bacteroidetes bacterium]|nr:hypothetical protein [Bacteroidota bacterium]MDF2450703.1 hypothetical protein [Bacteroidota bacterium]
MKKKLLSIIFVLVCGCLLAQKNYEKSEAFDEFDGWTKLLQLRNNNTGLMEISKKEGVNFTLFNAQKKKISSGKLPLTKLGEKLNLVQIEGVYDISGDYVAFIIGTAEDNKKKPVFYRLIIDGNNGKLKSEEVIGELDEMTMGAAYGMVFGDTDVPTFVIEKDPDSDYYAIIKYNTIAAETKDRIEVSHFGPDHKMINKANYNTPTDKYKFTKFLSAYVHGSDYVLIGTSAFNTKKSGGEEVRYYVAQLNKGKTLFVQKELQYTEYTKSAKSYFIYNKPKNMVTMMLLLPVAKSNRWSQLNQNINPTSMALDKPYQADYSKIESIYKTKMERKDEFGGMIQGSFVDKAGNLTFLIQQTIKKLGSGGMGMPAPVEATIFGDVALITMSPEGKEVSSALFPYSVYRKGDHDPFCYNSARKGRRVNSGFSPVSDNDWYYGIDFISTDNASYLFFNNTIDNMEKPENKEAGMIRGISGTNGVMYTYKGGTLKKEFMFGQPADKKEAKFINPGSSDYNATTKTYCTVLTDPKLKKSTVVWTKLD